MRLYEPVAEEAVRVRDFSSHRAVDHKTSENEETGHRKRSQFHYLPFRVECPIIWGMDEDHEEGKDKADSVEGSTWLDRRCISSLVLKPQ